MIIRHGFVSNSSSSSFIIHKSEFKNPDNFQKIINDLGEFEMECKDPENGLPRYWGDRDYYYEYNDSYVCIENNYVSEYISEIFERNGENWKEINKFERYS